MPRPENMIDRERSDRNLSEAVDWLILLRDADGDRALHTAFENWLDAEPDRIHAWQKACRTWQHVGEISPVLASDRLQLDHSGTSQPRHPTEIPPARDRRWGPSRPKARRHLIPGAIAAAAAACVLLIFASSWSTWLEADYATSTGEMREVRLADESAVHLSSSSAIATDFTPEHRTVTLLSGEAFFDVMPDAQRPFAVKSDGVIVTAVGTAFDVRLDSEAITIGVLEGSVALRHETRPPALLGPGDQAIVDRRSGEIVQEHVPLHMIADWRDGVRFYENATIGQVVDELRRYQTGWIIIADDGLSERRVTGLYDLHDPDRALLALVEPFGGSVTEVTPLLRILATP